MHGGTGKMAAVLVLYGFFLARTVTLDMRESILEEYSVISVVLILTIIWNTNLCLCITDSSQRRRILGLLNP
jgi:hypothetical protein